MFGLARCHYPERASLLDRVCTTFQLAKMTATGAVELPIEVGATAAVDTTIAGTVGEKVSPIVDQSRDQSSATLAQSQRQGIESKPGIEVKEDVKSASNHDPEKQAQGAIIDNRASESTVGEVGTTTFANIGGGQKNTNMLQDRLGRPKGPRKSP